MSNSVNLLPSPRYLARRRGFFVLPRTAQIRLDGDLAPELVSSVGKRLGSFGVSVTKDSAQPCIRAVQNQSAPDDPEGYSLDVEPAGIEITFCQSGGLHASIATLRQLLRQYGRKLPCLTMRDWPDFNRRGVMLDISRGRVPKLKTLLELADHLADFKINELQLYTEHTFAYKKYRAVWQSWGALTGKEIRRLDAHCRELGIELVPNQNSFGHLREFLADPRLQPLAEVAKPYESDDGSFLRYPSTLAPNHPGTVRFLRGLYQELLPNFSSSHFNVGCDETWDLGRGQSRELCRCQGKGRVYVDFLKQIQGEVARHDRQMMFWGDIVLKYPELLKELPQNVIALNWGYEADHPFDQEAARFAQAGIPFYVCPGTSTWMTLIGRHDNTLRNLRVAAEAGVKHGAIGYLITDWGDGGHPQPLAVSYLPYLAGAALSWCAKTFDRDKLIPVLSRDVFNDPTQCAAKAALSLGFAHRKLNYFEANATPLGAVIAAPPPEQRELFCRNGLKYYARISPRRIKAALAEIQRNERMLARAQPKSANGKRLLTELKVAASLAAHSCHFMLWQQAIAAGKKLLARRMAAPAVRGLLSLAKNFEASWQTRNKGNIKRCAAFFRWRSEDYRRGTLPGRCR